MVKICSPTGNQLGCELVLDFEIKWFRGSRVKNINYHQILGDPHNEATPASCVKAHRLFLILETCIVSAAVRRCCSQLQQIDQQVKLTLCAKLAVQCPLWPSLCSEVWRKGWNTGKRYAYSMRKEGKLHPAVKLCGCVCADIWLMQILLWIGCQNGADCVC